MENLDYKAMLRARVHLGHITSRWNPRFAPYILREEQGRHIIDCHHTLRQMEEAIEALEKILEQGGKVLFVGTKVQARQAVQACATALESFYTVQKWPAGLLTNFRTNSKNIKQLGRRPGPGDGTYEHRTKAEQAKLETHLNKVEQIYHGVQEMHRLPAAVLVVDARHENTAVREARVLGIPVFGLVDTNTDPGTVDYPIPANDDSESSISLLMGHLSARLKPARARYQESKAHYAGMRKPDRSAGASATTYTPVWARKNAALVRKDPRSLAYTAASTPQGAEQEEAADDTPENTSK